jgi:hypothetical protein
MLGSLAVVVLFAIIAMSSFFKRKEYLEFFGSALVVFLFCAGIATVIGFCCEKVPIVIETKELAALSQSADSSKQVFVKPLKIYGVDYVSFRFKTTPPSEITILPLADFDKPSESKTNKAYLKKSKLHFKKPWYYLVAIKFPQKPHLELCIPKVGGAQ